MSGSTQGSARPPEHIRDQTEQYRSVFEATPDGLIIVDVDGHIAEANAAYCAMVGYTRDELHGRSFQAAIAGVRKDGSRFPADISTRSFTYTGQPHTLAVVRDLSHTGLTQDRAQEKEAGYRAIFEATIDGMVIVDGQGTIVEANPTLCRLLNYPREELVGRHVRAVVHPDDIDIFVGGLRATDSGVSARDQARLLRRDGTTFAGGGQGRAFVYRGEPHTLAIIRNTTVEARAYDLLEQRVQERTRELSAVLEVSRRVASTLDLEPLLGLILDQLKTVVDYSGAAIFIVEEEYVRVLDYRGPLPREQMLDVRIPLERALGYQAVVRQKDPVIVDDLWSMTPLVSEIGDLRSYFETTVQYANSLLVVPLVVKERVIGVVRIDHTEPRAYSPRHAMLAMAFASQAAIAIENARLYARAHDMATLEERHRLARELHDSVTQALYGVTMYAEAAASLMEAGQQETATAYLREVRETSQEALKEMRLLIFELRPPVLAEEGLEGALRARLTAVEGRVNGISATMDVEGDLHMPAHVEEAVYGIAQEALNNIFKHARATSVSLSIRREAATLTLGIVDDGVGFDPSLIRGQGGLGLNGMMERAAQAGGHLTVESAPGQGTRIRAEVAL